MVLRRLRRLREERRPGTVRFLAGWRDSACQDVQDDLDALLNVDLPLAEQSLRESGEFYPYAASMSSDGQISIAMAGPEGDDVPSVAGSMVSLLAVDYAAKGTYCVRAP